MNDHDLLEGFESSTLTHFPHEYHVRVVYLLILEYGPEEAEDRMVAGIRGLASNFGLSGSFIHITRTVAWTKIVASQIDQPMSSEEFVRAHPALLRKDLLDDYYAWGRLLTPGSRRRFVQPSRPFPTAPGELASAA